MLISEVDISNIKEYCCLYDFLLYPFNIILVTLI